MIVPIVLAITVSFILFQAVLFPKTEKKKSPEDEVKEAVAKYISQTVKLPKPEEMYLGLQNEVIAL